MKDIAPSLSLTFRLFFKDKLVLLLGAIPIVLGIALYVGVGHWFFTWTTTAGKAWILSLLGDGGWGVAIYYVLMALFMLALFFIVNWTFVLVVSIISSPFCDALSSRVEKLVRGKQVEEAGFTFKRIFSYAMKIIINESKKTAVVLFFSILAFMLGLIPVLGLLGLAISATLLSIQFLNYSWSRHDLPFRRCWEEVKRNFLTYLVTGALFGFIISIPLLNLLAIPLGTVFYTILWTKKALPSS